MNRYFLLFCWLLLPWVSRANHAIGGELSMQLLNNKPGSYRIQLIQYWETANVVNGPNGNADPVVRVMIFRKKNPILVQIYELSLQAQTALPYNNEVCSRQKNLVTTKATYYADYQLDLSQYTDPGGYYMVWERCCRNSAMVNLANPVEVGMMLYLEFPALTQNGTSFINSSPNFSKLTGDYICVNRPFTYDMSATDADGDQLRYSLVTPYQGYTTALEQVPNTLPHTSYPLVTWQVGYSAQSAIPGNPALQIDPATGRLTVRASRTGIFLFSVQVDEYRNGVYIGQTRRDFQLPVIDCAVDRPPVAVIKLDTAAVTLVNWCNNTPLTLTVENRPEWAYQWQKDGIKLPGATSTALTITDAGDYTVLKSFSDRCSSDTVSAVVKVRRVAPPSVKLTLIGRQPACVGDAVVLKTDTLPAAQYRWQRNGQLITGASTTRLAISQSGLYKVLVRPATYTCDGQDSSRITINQPPTTSLLAAKTQFCVGDSVLLTAPAGTNQQYTWFLNGAPLTTTSQATLQVKQGGNYRVMVTAPGGCTAQSGVVSLTSSSSQSVALDSIPASCASDPPRTLVAQPAGGQFTGPGIQGNRFNPAIAGPGRHQITYTLTATVGCGAQQSRWAVVQPRPGLMVPPAYTVTANDTVRLVARTSQPGVAFQWTPPLYLSDPTVATPIARPAESVTYRVIAISPAGCADTAQVQVTVDIRIQLYIPTAFSPNGDGINDVWDIKNVSAFPDSEVIVYDRWGTVVFASVGYVQPWNGRNGNDRVGAGIYAYRIKTGRNEFRGQLLIME